MDAHRHSAPDAPVGLADWLEREANATRLRICEHALHNFRIRADGDPTYTMAVSETVWEFLLGAPPGGEDPMGLLVSIRHKLEALRPDQLDALSRKLEGAAERPGGAPSESGRLVAGWFRTIALSRAALGDHGRALHVGRAYEKTFATMARLTARGPTDPSTHAVRHPETAGTP
jgi:hypothetical protein